MTFAIAARCGDTGQFGVGIATRAIAVSARCPFIAAGFGVVVTMARTDPRLGPLGLNLLRAGYSAPKVLEELAASDPNIEHRQVCVIDRDGNAVARTGAKNKVWSGAFIENGVVAMGNNLTSEATARAMFDSWKKSGGQTLAERLVAAIEAGRDAGGQNGGQQSAGVHVYDREPFYAYVDVRVDSHAEPVGELRRVWEIYRPLAPYYYGRPGRPEEYGREEEWLARHPGRTNTTR